MNYRISKYAISSVAIRSISLLLLLLFVFALARAQAQQPQSRPVQVPKRDQKKQKKDEAPKDTIPLFNGAYVGIDLFGIGNNLFGGDAISAEVSLVANIKNLFLPTLELGYGATDAWNETGIHYKAAAPYFRIGVDYNTMAKKRDKRSYLYVGLRYGFTSFKYDVSSLPVHDPVWNDNIGNPSVMDPIWGGETLPYNHPGMTSTVHWFELLAGVKVNIYKNFSMGWAVRMKYKLSGTTSEYGNPWYVPGYGAFKSSNIGVTYSLIYNLPIKKK